MAAHSLILDRPVMRTLYPEIEPCNSYLQKAGSFHEIYFEESGNPRGVPILFIHGGPGSGSTEKHRRYFDPARYRIINFDQRGCNRSRPPGEIRENTTRELLADMELIRQSSHIQKWLLFGGSWGATLALLYAQQHPEHVSGLILRGTFLGRRKDLDWFVHDGANRILPEAWSRFRDFIPADERNDLVAAYYHRLRSEDEITVANAARHWAAWSGHVVTYQLNISDYDIDWDLARVVNEVMIETHYARHAYFIEENQILRNIGRVPDVPITLIHGRLDLTCTVDASWELHQALPGSRLIIVREGGHLASEPVMTDVLVNATDTMAELARGNA